MWATGDCETDCSRLNMCKNAGREGIFITENIDNVNCMQMISDS